MPYIALATLAAALTLSSCGFAQQKSTSAHAPKTTLPADYQTWPQINAETIMRDEEDDDGTVTSSSAVELYARVEGDLGQGTILIKATHAVVEGAVGDAEQIGLMRRTGGESNGGWQFEAFAPLTGAPSDVDVASCSNCHALQADNDYLFSTRADVLNASP